MVTSSAQVSAPERFLPTQQVRIPRLALARFSATPPASTTRQPVVTRSPTAPPVTVTRPAVLLRSLTTLTGSRTRPTVVARSFSTLPATVIQLQVSARSRGNSTGNDNTAIGRSAGFNITGSGNVCI